MNSYYTYFHPEKIIRLLCKYRFKYTKKKHKLHLLADISNSERTISDIKEKAIMPEELSKLFPSRRSWYKPTLNERKKFSDSQKLNEYALLKTISTTHLKSKNPTYIPPNWYINLDRFIKHIQTRINNPDLEKIKCPEISPIKKEKKKDCKECRPISMYDFEDRIIISLTAKYFTETFDDIFLDCSYAFRAVKKIGLQKIARTHHDAIIKIAEYREKRTGCEIYAAECDLQKFFDCVNHQIVLDKLQSISSSNNISLDGKAIAIFKQYLDSYSFSKNVFPLNSSSYFQDRNMPEAKFKWALTDLKKQYYPEHFYNENLENIGIGVPQGGALSCFISNLLLHSVDCAVENMADKDLLYLRFCDDMIILHTNKEKCQQALDKYENSIKKIKLLTHIPQEITVYSRLFWNKTKSKKPYRWASKEVIKSNVPWLSFVGYQIKYDGSIRVRKKSFQKEIKKQREECLQILKALQHSKKELDINTISKKSKRQQLFALENRLISMSVGRVRLYEKDKKKTLCWTNGFKALNNNPTALKQLKLLDASRTKNLYFVKKKLNELTRRTENPDLNLLKGKIYFGSPFSYSNFLRIDSSR